MYTYLYIYTYTYILYIYIYIYICIYIKYLSAGKADSKEVKRIADDFATQVKILTSLLATKLNSLPNWLCIMARRLIFEKSHHESNPATKWMQVYNFSKCLLPINWLRAMTKELIFENFHRKDSRGQVHEILKILKLSAPHQIEHVKCQKSWYLRIFSTPADLAPDGENSKNSPNVCSLQSWLRKMAQKLILENFHHAVGSCGQVGRSPPRSCLHWHWYTLLCSTLSRTATHCKALQTLQHSATHNQSFFGWHRYTVCVYKCLYIHVCMRAYRQMHCRSMNSLVIQCVHFALLYVCVYRVAKTNSKSYLYRSFSAKEPYN